MIVIEVGVHRCRLKSPFWIPNTHALLKYKKNRLASLDASLMHLDGVWMRDQNFPLSISDFYLIAQKKIKIIFHVADGMYQSNTKCWSIISNCIHYWISKFNWQKGQQKIFIYLNKNLSTWFSCIRMKILLYQPLLWIFQPNHLLKPIRLLER